MTQDKTKCPTCGSRVTVEGKTTQHYVPCESFRDEAKELLGKISPPPWRNLTYSNGTHIISDKKSMFLINGYQTVDELEFITISPELISQYETLVQELESELQKAEEVIKYYGDGAYVEVNKNTLLVSEEGGWEDFGNKAQQYFKDKEVK